jgi:hypothetical protein
MIKRLLPFLLIAAAVALAAGQASSDQATEGGRAIITLKATGEADGNDTLRVVGSDYSFVRGRALYELATIPGTGAQQPSAWTGSIVSSSEGTRLTIPTRSATAKESLPGSYTLGFFPPIVSGWTITLTGIGEGNTVTVRLIFW